jgi:serine/threonine protein kinase
VISGIKAPAALSRQGVSSDYEIIEFLGEGKRGNVFKATNSSGTGFAIKEPNNDDNDAVYEGKKLEV